MKVTVYNRQKDLRLPIRHLKKVIGAFLLFKKVRCSEVIIHFVSQKKICEIHDLLFQAPSPTDCISVPIDSPEEDSPFSQLGEVFVCPKVALEYGGDPLRETLLYVLHGLLHLLGYDDIAKKDRAIMRKEERKALRFIASIH